MEKEIEELKKIKGEAAGIVFKTDREFILKEKGEEGLREVEAETKKMGWLIDYNKIETYKWYPVGLRAVSLLATKKAFDWSDDMIKKMGQTAPTHSLFIKLMARMFSSLTDLPQKAEEGWRKHYSIGKLIIIEINEEKKQATWRLKDFKIHPLLCDVYLGGYFAKTMGLMVRGKNFESKTLKCQFRGDSYHEYLITWQ